MNRFRSSSFAFYYIKGVKLFECPISCIKGYFNYNRKMNGVDSPNLQTVSLPNAFKIVSTVSISSSLESNPFSIDVSSALEDLIRC